MAKTREQIEAELKAAEAARLALEAELAAIEDEEEVEDTRPVGEKIGSALGKLIAGSKKQSTSFFGGLKDELIKGGVIKPSKKRK